jgi:hypothetical protein
MRGTLDSGWLSRTCTAPSGVSSANSVTQRPAGTNAPVDSRMPVTQVFCPCSPLASMQASEARPSCTVSTIDSCGATNIGCDAMVPTSAATSARTCACSAVGTSMLREKKAAWSCVGTNAAASSG